MLDDQPFLIDSTTFLSQCNRMTIYWSLPLSMTLLQCTCILCTYRNGLKYLHYLKHNYIKCPCCQCFVLYCCSCYCLFVCSCCSYISSDWYRRKVLKVTYVLILNAKSIILRMFLNDTKKNSPGSNTMLSRVMYNAGEHITLVIGSTRKNKNQWDSCREL